MRHLTTMDKIYAGNGVKNEKTNIVYDQTLLLKLEIGEKTNIHFTTNVTIYYISDFTSN